jgi:hypothetical protein
LGIAWTNASYLAFHANRSRRNCRILIATSLISGVPNSPGLQMMEVTSVNFPGMKVFIMSIDMTISLRSVRVGVSVMQVTKTLCHAFCSRKHRSPLNKHSVNCEWSVAAAILHTPQQSAHIPNTTEHLLNRKIRDQTRTVRRVILGSKILTIGTV